MSELSLIQYARAEGTRTVYEMATKAGLSFPPPSISVRSLIRLLGLPSQPRNLRLFWDLDVGGEIIYHAPNDQGVPIGKTIQFDWEDADDSTIRRAHSWQLDINMASTGRAFGHSPFLVQTTPNLGDIGFLAGSSYEWRVTPFNEIGQGPSSPTFTFGTSPPAKPPLKKPSISVAYHGPAKSAKFSIKGADFLSNHVVYVRGVNDADVLHPAFAETTSDSSGAITMDADIPCSPGTQLSFSANDGRSDPDDLTGTLISNTVTITAT